MDRLIELKVIHIPIVLLFIMDRLHLFDIVLHFENRYCKFHCTNNDQHCI